MHSPLPRLHLPSLTVFLGSSLTEIPPTVGLRTLAMSSSSFLQAPLCTLLRISKR
ncbi:hypothetical protein [Psittacid alphaherpesvirus 5]|uniref:Uncharacterized protein n=1 Tax=Psittacid alphaherpesvirus 5 TaxID=2972693 RepID=A0A5P9JX62_9ALPH|nr:hypothetical protein QKU09_gp60 [Psittacid alphaherpesvirus 5]QFU14604.1 hypothetical protein [Psittacid alphaherpesvirus 5]UOO01075.1 hypothetical protein [Psittacid alphaherpesvirus 5]